MFCFQAEDGIRDLVRSRGLGDVYKRQGLRKKHIEPRGLTWEDAVPEALCFGWIDSVVHSMGPDAVRQRWSPRRRGSTWSKVNIALIEQLTAEGRMHPAGLAAYAARSEDKQGIYAYEQAEACLLYTSPSPRDRTRSRRPSSACKITQRAASRLHYEHLPQRVRLSV